MSRPVFRTRPARPCNTASPCAVHRNLCFYPPGGARSHTRAAHAAAAKKRRPPLRAAKRKQRNRPCMPPAHNCHPSAKYTFFPPGRYADTQNSLSLSPQHKSRLTMLLDHIDHTALAPVLAGRRAVWFKGDIPENG